MNYNEWINHNFSSGSYAGNDYLKFQQQMKEDLQKMAYKYYLELHSFNNNHYEFSAVLKDEDSEHFIYVSISDVRYFKNSWFNNVLIRTMKHDKDWTGGTNNSCKWTDIGEKARTLINNMKKQEKLKDLDLEIDR